MSSIELGDSGGDAVTSPRWESVVSGIRRRLFACRAIEGAYRLWRLRAQVVRAVRERSHVSPRPASPDALRVHEVPSVARLGAGDRVLAEIDQDGYEFAVHPIDSLFFESRDVKLPRIRYQVSVVLRSGQVCLAKRFRLRPFLMGPRVGLKNLFGLDFLTEAAALIRLKDSDAAPRLIDIDLRTRTIYREFIRGQSGRQILARQGLMKEDADLRFGPAAATSRARSSKWARIPPGSLALPTRQLMAQINAGGVVLLDVKLGNIVKGERSGALYWIDFEHSRFLGDWDWNERLGRQQRMLDECLEAALAARPAHAAAPVGPACTLPVALRKHPTRASPIPAAFTAPSQACRVP